MIEILTDQEISSGFLLPKPVAVIGYGNQGQAHALNLRDSGIKVIVGQRSCGKGFEQAQADGFEPLAIDLAVSQAELIILALPDEVAPQVYKELIEPLLEEKHTLGFIHGFNIHYEQIVPPKNLDVILVAPKGAGYMVRESFVAGRGLVCFYALFQDQSGTAKESALAWAAAIGCGRAGVIRATFAAETETDLFGEQVSVVGGVTALVKSAFEVLVDAGYEPEHAYFECVHELKFVVDLIHKYGLSGMRSHISDTAEYGDLTRHQRLVYALKPVMKSILEDITSGQFANEWIEENRSGRKQFGELFEKDSNSQLEKVGRELRDLIDPPPPKTMP